MYIKKHFLSVMQNRTKRLFGKSGMVNFKQPLIRLFQELLFGNIFELNDNFPP